MDFDKFALGFAGNYITFAVLVVVFVGLAQIVKSVPVLWLIPAVMSYVRLDWEMTPGLMFWMRLLFWVAVIGAILLPFLGLVRSQWIEPLRRPSRGLAIAPICMIVGMVTLILTIGAVHDYFLKNEPPVLLLDDQRFWLIIALLGFAAVILFLQGVKRLKWVAAALVLLLGLIAVSFIGWHPSSVSIPGVSTKIDDPFDRVDDSGDVCDAVDGSPDSLVQHSLPSWVKEVTMYGEDDQYSDCHTVKVAN